MKKRKATTSKSNATNTLVSRRVSWREFRGAVKAVPENELNWYNVAYMAAWIIHDELLSDPWPEKAPLTFEVLWRNLFAARFYDEGQRPDPAEFKEIRPVNQNGEIVLYQDPHIHAIKEAISKLKADGKLVDQNGILIPVAVDTSRKNSPPKKQSSALTSLQEKILRHLHAAGMESEGMTYESLAGKVEKDDSSVKRAIKNLTRQK